MKSIRAKYRILAAIHHPDSNYGSHQRMTQLNAAMDLLRRHIA
jgi:DnaJ-class molecular chaperone